jgi:hypothetical protein
MRKPSFRALKLVLTVALSACVLGAGELGWRVYALWHLAELQRQLPPISAEAMATKAAPLLRAASNAEPIYAIVQNQHVELSMMHGLLSDLSANWHAEASAALVAVIVLFGLLALAYRWVVNLERHYAPASRAG